MAGPDPNTIATIYAANQKFTAWESVMVERAYGRGISTFQFSAAEGYYGDKMLGLQIQPGDPVTIALAGQLAFTGWCSMRAGAYDSKSHQVIISGESQTTDLAKSSVLVQPGTFDGSTFEQAARAVMAPHNVSLVMANPPDGADQPFQSLAVQYGEKVASFISRIAAARNLHLTDNPQGQLVAGLATAGTSSATLVEGKNILAARFKLRDPSSLTWFQTRGVSSAPGNDNNFPPRAYSATSTFTGARANLLGLYVAEHPDDSQALVGAVTHQVFRSLWNQIEIDVDVPGWLAPDGTLWAPAPTRNATVSLFSPLIFPGQTGLALLAIQAVRFQQDSQNGTTTTLTLRRSEWLTQSNTAGASDTGTGSSSAMPSVSADSPDYQTST